MVQERILYNGSTFILGQLSVVQEFRAHEGLIIPELCSRCEGNRRSARTYHQLPIISACVTNISLYRDVFVGFGATGLPGPRIIVRMVRLATCTRFTTSLALATIICNACAGPVQRLDIATVSAYKYAVGCASGSDPDGWVRLARQCNLQYGFHCDNEGHMKHRKDNMVCQKSCGCHKLRAEEVSQFSDG